MAQGQADNADESPLADPLTIAIRLAQRLVAGERASLLLPIDRSGELRIVAASNVPVWVVATARIPLGAPVAGAVAETRKPILVNGKRTTPVDRMRLYRTGSYLSVPVPLVNGTTGVLNVADPIGQEEFRPADLDTLRDFALYLAHDLAHASEESKLRRQVFLSREDERLRIARDLHDEFGHKLLSAILRLDSDLLNLSRDETAAREALKRARASLVETTNAIHDVAYMLTPQILEDLGLLAAIDGMINQNILHGPTITLTMQGTPRPLPKVTEVAIYRIIQEALTNIHKHARASEASLHLIFDELRVMIIVEDNGLGRGEDPNNTGTFGLGLRGMSERLALLEGFLTISNRDEGGVRLIAVLPG